MGRGAVSRKINGITTAITNFAISSGVVHLPLLLTGRLLCSVSENMKCHAS